MERILKILEEKIAEYENRIACLREENARLQEKIAQYETPKKVANV